MKALRILFILAMVISLTALNSSCNKDKDNTTNNNTSWASDNALAEKAYGDVKNISDEAVGPMQKASAEDTIYLGPCVLVTLNKTDTLWTLTIDFGTTNCLCNDGRYRRGKLITSINGLYWATGTVLTYTFDNYFVDDNQVLGTETVTNIGPNTLGHPVFHVVVNGSIIKANNGGTITWNSDRLHEWAAGYNTPEWWDDIYLVTGSGNGTDANGKTYTINITSALEIKLNCHWVVTGKLDIQPQDYPLIQVDYGDGTCNADATVIINGVTYTITMP
ncbi:MAG TPA: hypothetical protein VMC08_08700 [Bacteroidales bacterium]|nr:hypothetical protein [Bacteroidales bacterium]